MKRLLALLATGAALAGAAPSLAVVVPVTFNLSGVSPASGILTDTVAIDPVSIGAGALDLQINFAPGQAVTLIGKIDLQALLQAATGSTQTTVNESASTLKLFNGGTLVGTYSNDTATSGQFTVGDDFDAGDNWTFDASDSVTFTSMDLSLTLDSGTPTRTYDKSTISLSAQSVAVSGVPEPATWGMMVIGFGAMGAAMRRKGRASSFAI